MNTLNHAFVKENLPKRQSYQNKGDFGHVLVIGGSVGMAGAVCMTAKAALRAGAGLVTVAVPEPVLTTVAANVTECMTLPLPADMGCIAQNAVRTVRPLLKKANTVVIGMGARVCAGLLALLEEILTGFNGTVILDADALNTLSQNKELLAIPANARLICTPHPGEMARLCNTSVSKIQTNRQQFAVKWANESKGVSVLKGENTLIAYQNELYVNPTGNVGMATGGSGDVLSGIIAGLCAQMPEKQTQAVCCGVYLHGLAGDLAVQDKTVYGLIATDLIEYLPKAFLACMNS